MSLTGANNSTNDIVAPSSNEFNESVHRVPTIARRTASVGSSSVGSRRSSHGGGNAATTRINTSTSASTTIFGSSDRNRIARTGSKQACRHADNEDDNISMQQLMKMSFMQREQDRTDCQVEEWLRRDEMRQNQQFLQQMMMTTMFAMGYKTATSNRNQENDSSNNKEQQDEDRHQDP
jgi:hypothetical protein